MEKNNELLDRVLVRAPQIILADEPTGNLDAQNAHLVFDCFQEVARAAKTTVIIVTHDEKIASHCDQIIDMSCM